MTEESAIGHYGWNRQRPDWRDEQYRFSVPIGVALPSHFDLVKKMPQIWNQGNIGSCTAHGSLKVYVADRMKEGQPVFMPSRLFQYYNSRSMEGTIASDAGASVRDAIKAIAQWGACDESSVAVRHQQVHAEASRQRLQRGRPASVADIPAGGAEPLRNQDGNLPGHSGNVWLYRLSRFRDQRRRPKGSHVDAAGLGHRWPLRRCLWMEQQELYSLRQQLVDQLGGS